MAGQWQDRVYKTYHVDQYAMMFGVSKHLSSVSATTHSIFDARSFEALKLCNRVVFSVFFSLLQKHHSIVAPTLGGETVYRGGPARQVNFFSLAFTAANLARTGVQHTGGNSVKPFQRG